MWLVNIPVVTIYKLQVWRIATSLFTPLGLISLLIAGLMVWYVSHTDEVEKGTARTLLKYVYYHVVVQAAFTLFAVLVVGGMFKYYKLVSSGIWPVYFVFMTMRLMANPEGYSQ
jgi:hypothetical protein